jgi:hypothetical protein
MGIPLRPDPLALRAMERRSFTRATTALFMAHRRGTQPTSFWRDDNDADAILKAVSTPLATTGTFPQIQATKVLPMLAPDSASSKLLAMGANLDLSGIATVRIPYIGGAGRPQQPAFIAEGAPIPIANLATSAATLGTKIRVLAGPHFADAVLTSAYIPAGWVAGVIPQGLAAGYAGIAQIETSTAATVHMEDTTPLAIGAPGSPPTVAAPTLSAFQSGLIVIKVRGRCAWCVQPGAVSLVTGAAW